MASNTDNLRLFHYFDKHGHEIKEGMLIRIGDDPPERVYACCTQEGDEDLGVNASNEEYLKFHPDTEREYYPLNNFNAELIEIIEEG